MDPRDGQDYKLLAESSDPRSTGHQLSPSSPRPPLIPYLFRVPRLFTLLSLSLSLSLSGGGMSARRRRERPMTMKHAVTVCGGGYKRRRERPAREQRTRGGGYEHGATAV